MQILLQLDVGLKKSMTRIHLLSGKELDAHIGTIPLQSVKGFRTRTRRILLLHGKKFVNHTERTLYTSTRERVRKSYRENPSPVRERVRKSYRENPSPVRERVRKSYRGIHLLCVKKLVNPTGNTLLQCVKG